MSKMVRRFVRNCDICNRTHVWRIKKREFLRPLPIPGHFFQKLSIDFITNLPAEDNQPHNFMVHTDRSSKVIIIEAIPTMDAETCAQIILQCYYRLHGFHSGNYIRSR